jgi:hypothetical protein
LTRALGPQSERHADGDTLGTALREAYACQPPPPDQALPHRRATTRATYATPVLVVRHEGGAIDGRSEDISEGGVLVVSSAALEPRERVNLTFALPLSFEVVTVTAVCRWVKSARDGAHAVGFQFIDPGGDVIEDIHEYVAFFGGALV